MQNTSKTKAQLQQELAHCGRRISELEVSEQTFRQTTERFQDYFDNIEDGCFEMDLHGHIVFGNKKAHDLLGYSLDEYNAMYYQKRHPTKEEADRIFRAFHEVYKTGKSLKAFECQLVHKNGEIRTLEVTLSLIRAADGRPVGFRGINRDITNRIEMKKTLERYRDYVENIEDICAEYDLKGRCIFCNNAMFSKLGYTREEYMATSHRQRHPSPQQAERVFKTFNKVYRTGIPVTYEEILLHKDGKTESQIETCISLIRNSEGQPIGFRSIGRDISERKKVEAEQERFRNFLENVTDSCAEYDLKGHCLYANGALSRKLGYTREEFMATGHRKRHPSEEEAKRVFKIFNEIYRTGVPQTFEDIVLHKDGQTVSQIELSVSLMRDASGKPIGFLSIGRDITERKKNEAERERYRTFVENVEDACFEMDLAGKFTFANDIVFKITGFSREEYLKLEREQRHPSKEESERIFRTHEEIYRTGQPVTMFEYDILRKDGQVRTMESSISLIRDNNSRPSGFRCIARDVTERKLILKEQERYRNFLENVTDSCSEYDLKGHCLYSNGALSRKLGYTREEFMATGHRQRHPLPEEAERVFKIFNEIYRTGVPQTYEEVALHKDGQTVSQVELSVSLMRDASGKPVGFRSIGRDITERKKNEAERERYRTFVENVEDACFETDLNGKTIFGNEALQRSTGYSFEELSRIRPQDLHPADYPKIKKIYEKTYQTGEPARLFDYQTRRKDGVIRDVQASISLIRDKNGQPIGFRGIARDVTERKLAEKEQERYRNFLESIEDVCFEVDLEGKFTFVNEAAVRQFGYTKDQILGLDNRQYSTSTESNRLFKTFNEIYRTGQPAKVFDLEFNTEKTGIRHLDLSVSLIRDEEGKPVGFRGIAQDITERKKLIEQLQQAQKLEAIGTLAGGIAHDFNNLLMGIQGYTSLILMETEPSHPNYEKLEAIESQVKSGADLTKQLLGYARGGRYEVKPVDINDLIGKTIDMFARTKKELRIHQNFAPDLRNVEADRGQMEQVMLNLFVNAWQAMPGGGALYLETGNILLDETDTKPYDIQPGPYIKISVTDTGVGMDETTKSRIFEPFFTTKEMGRGAGLGLASVYGIVTGHKGMIRVYSEKGHGSTFNIYLPASKKDAIVPDERTSKVLKGQETILLVDDEQVITEVTGAMIQGLGYRVIIARSGEEAVEIYRANQDQINLVIMDMIMPGSGGGTAIDRIRTMTPEIKIILSSGYSLNGEAKDIMNRGGAQAFLQKPFSFGVLSQKIREVLEM
jgi:two-component system, cell cycle sensor histidine kinase and response regulator CckA